MLYPLTFQPRFKERIWGGRNLERLYSKPLPPRVLIGESWELCDRPGDVSVVSNGPLAGRDLRWVMENHSTALLGDVQSPNGRFPLLVKLLDARETLSLQVHPPASQAARLGGEPKTEMWHITAATPHAELFVGLKRTVTRTEFERRIHDGTVADCLHRVPVQAGDTMFLPSGRVHALGEGLVLFEIQQNSDTTYRVFDWNRQGTDGKPRELHIAESLASIDFGDFEPSLVQSQFCGDPGVRHRTLVTDPLFTVEEWKLPAGTETKLHPGVMQIVACLSGRLRVTGSQLEPELSPGSVCLLPACLPTVGTNALSETAYLNVTAGHQFEGRTSLNRTW